MGGLPAGPIDLAEHELSEFDKRVDALLMLLTNAPREAFRIDALRRAIEMYGEEDYESYTYYERWMGAIKRLLVEQEVLSEQEIERKIAEIKARPGGAGA